MAYNGAFYLGPDYHDCYDLSKNRNRNSQGNDAMLIYQFKPEILSKKGKRVLDKKKWKVLAGERSLPSSRIEDDWIYTYQNADPAHVTKFGDNARTRKGWNQQPAMQLIIYTERMCKKVHENLIGCVYYENFNAPNHF